MQQVRATHDPDELSAADDWHPFDAVTLEQRCHLIEGGIFGHRNDLASHHVLRMQAVRLHERIDSQVGDQSEPP